MAVHVFLFLFQSGGNFFKVSNWRLTFTQWGLCLALSLSTIIAAILGKLLNIDNCIDKIRNCFSKTEEMKDDNNNNINRYDKSNTNFLPSTTGNGQHMIDRDV